MKQQNTKEIMKKAMSSIERSILFAVKRLAKLQKEAKAAPKKKLKKKTKKVDVVQVTE
jgi:hypothetical protein